MKIKYFSALYDGQLFGLFQSNNDKAIDFQIKQLMKSPKMVIKEVSRREYERLQKQAVRLKALGNG